MTATAEAYAYGARAPYAQMRESEYDMKRRVRLSGLFPRVRNEPMTVQLQALLKEFENNAALTAILERRRRLEEKTQYELRSREAVQALLTNLAPPFRTGNASFATSAAVAQKVADEVPAPVAPPVAPFVAGAAAATPAVTKQKDQSRVRKFGTPKVAATDAAAVMTGSYSQGDSVSSEGFVISQREVRGRSRTPAYPSPRRRK